MRTYDQRSKFPSVGDQVVWGACRCSPRCLNNMNKQEIKEIGSLTRHIYSSVLIMPIHKMEPNERMEDLRFLQRGRISFPSIL